MEQGTMDAPIAYADDRLQVDYFGFEETHRVYLPDKVSYVEHQVLAEGQRRRFLNQTARDVRVERNSGDAKMRMRPGDERYELLKAAIVGWNLVTKNRDGALEPVGFNGTTLEKWLATTNPRVVDLVEKDVRKHNPWLLANLTLEDIDKQLAELQEMRQVKVEEEEGKDS